jgi:prepilin-type N-terminal cleavage/methylation domain-containing protein
VASRGWLTQEALRPRGWVGADFVNPHEDKRTLRKETQTKFKISPEGTNTKMIETLTKKREDEGFTLIELLVVIVILGILAAVVVFAVGGITDHGQVSACKSDTKTIRTSEEALFANTNVSPAYATLNYTTTADMSAASGTLIPKYLAENSTMHYVTVSGGSYTIWVGNTNCGTVGEKVGQINAPATVTSDF